LTNARRGRKLVTVAVAWAVSAACSNDGVLRCAIAAQPGKAGSAVLTSLPAEIRLERGERQSHRFPVAQLPRGRAAVLVLSARLDMPKVAGHTPALRLTLNGTPLDGGRLVDKPLRARDRGGAAPSMAAGDRLTTYYGPDFTSPDSHPQYGLLDGVQACVFRLHVTDLLRQGQNDLVVENAAHPSVKQVLVVANARIELRQPSSPGEVEAGAPQGPLEVHEPRTSFRTAYRVQTLPNAMIDVAVGGEVVRLVSSFSTPKPEWVRGSNAYFRHERRVEPGEEAILVYDTFTNLTDRNLPLVHRHQAWLGDRVRGVWLGGLEQASRSGRTTKTSNATVLATTAGAGIGMIALDDVFRVHFSGQAEGGWAGIADCNLVLRPGAAYTAEWAVIPTDLPDYWRFINAARRLVGANFTVPGSFAFLRVGSSVAGWPDREVRDFLVFKNARFAATASLQGKPLAQVSPEPYREAFARRRRLVPGEQNLVYFHCFIDASDEAPQRYHDSRLLAEDGQQATYGLPHRRLFLPTMSNSYGRAAARNLQAAWNGIGADGVYWDEHEWSGTAYHYGPAEQWDGWSGDIDPKTLAVRRLKSSVVLLTEAWRVAAAKAILARGALVGNGVPLTKAMAGLKYPCFVETGSISHCAKAHLYSPIALGDHLTERSEEDAYRSMLAALNYGCVYYWYHDVNVRTTHHHLTSYMYPITPLELHQGFIIGEERIITNKSGLFGFGDQSRHEVHVFDDGGREVDHRTPVVRRNRKTYTELRLPRGWSAAVVRK